MKKRSCQILEQLLYRGKNYKIEELAKYYDVSQKTLQNDFSDINTFLKEINIPQLTVLKSGEIKLFDKKFDEYTIEKLNKLGNIQYIMEKKERVNLIIIILLKESKFITMNQLAEKLCVTRITILNDMIEVNLKLNKYNIEVLSKPGKGIIAAYDEYDARCLITHLLFDSYHSNERESNISNVYFIKLIKEIENNYTLESLKNILDEIIIDKKYDFRNRGYYAILFSLFVILNRRSNEITYIEENKRYSNKEYDIAKEIYEILTKKLDIIPNKNDIHYLAGFISNKGILKPLINVDDYVELHTTVATFLYKISEQLDISLYDEYSLFEFLIKHLNAMAMRIKNEELLINPIYEQLKEKYDYVFKAVKENIRLIEDFYKLKIDKNELSYIVMHICAEIERETTKMRKPSILIVCPESMAAGQLIAAQLEKYFDFNIKAIITDSYEISDNLNIDFIISTVVLPRLKYPVLIINTIIDAEDYNRIQTIIFSLIKDYKKLKKSIENKESLTLPGIKHRLYQSINPSLIKITDDITSWEEVLRQGGDLLINAGYASKDFSDDLIKSANLNGPYFVIRKGVGLAHALSKDSNYESAISLTVLKNGVKFNHPYNDPVKLLFSLVIKDSKSYLNIFNDVLKLSTNKDFTHGVINAKSEKEVYDIIVKESLKLN